MKCLVLFEYRGYQRGSVVEIADPEEGLARGYLQWVRPDTSSLAKSRANERARRVAEPNLESDSLLTEEE